MLGSKRFILMATTGASAQLTSQAATAATAITATPTSATLTASQRRRVTLCVHARRCVPLSNSRATIGAPQSIPSRAGIASSAGPRRPAAALAGGPSSGGAQSCWAKAEAVGVAQMHADRDRESGEHREYAQCDQQLRAELPPGDPDHRPILESSASTAGRRM